MFKGIYRFLEIIFQQVIFKLISRALKCRFLRGSKQLNKNYTLIL
jgi:hypothetical protein